MTALRLSDMNDYICEFAVSFSTHSVQILFSYQSFVNSCFRSKVTLLTVVSFFLLILALPPFYTGKWTRSLQPLISSQNLYVHFLIHAICTRKHCDGESIENTF
jgi:hypothetical protein